MNAFLYDFPRRKLIFRSCSLVDQVSGVLENLSTIRCSKSVLLKVAYAVSSYDTNIVLSLSHRSKYETIKVDKPLEPF